MSSAIGVGPDMSYEKPLNTKGLDPYDELIVADAERLPSRGGAFDLVTASEVVHGLSPHV